MKSFSVHKMRVLFYIVTVMLLMAILAVATNGIERAYKTKSRQLALQKGDRVIAGLVLLTARPLRVFLNQNIKAAMTRPARN